MSVRDADILNVDIYQKDSDGLILIGSYSGTTPTTADKFAKGCLLINSDTGYLYVNTGTSASPSFVNVADELFSGDSTFAGDVTVAFDNTVAGDTAFGLKVDMDQSNLTTGMRQGAFHVDLDRQSTDAMTGWDGNPDTGIKVIVNNRADNTIARNGVRALDIQARNRLVNAWVKTMELNGRNDSGATTVELLGLHIRMENYGTVNDSIIGLDIEMSSENDTSSPTKTAILVRNTDASGMTVVDDVIKISNTSTNGFGALLNLDGLTAANGTIVSTSGTAASDFAGRIRIIMPSGSAAWINVYSTSNEA